MTNVDIRSSQNNKPMPPGINIRNSMTRKSKLTKIKRLWNRKARECEWEDIEFGPEKCCCSASFYNLIEFPLVERTLMRDGFYMWAWGREQNIRDWLTWDHVLLSWIQAWFYLPEEYEAVLYVNEAARVIFIATAKYSSRFASLFQKPHSVKLGTRIPEVEKEVQTPAGALALPSITTTKAVPALPATGEVSK